MKKDIRKSIEVFLMIAGIFSFWILVIAVGYYFNFDTFPPLGILGIVVTSIWILIPVVGFTEEAK